jgi:hypothetical protein
MNYQRPGVDIQNQIRAALVEAIEQPESGLVQLVE